jgi:HEAT repeat protein
MKEERAVESLCRLLVSDPQADVRRTAAEALGEIRSQKALVSLTQALNDAELRVRAKAKWAISEIEDSDG